MRLFLALDFTDEIKNSLSNEISLLQANYPDFKWVKKPALHLTLKFLGDTEAALQGKIESTLNTAFLKTDCFELESSLPGFFPNPRKARVYYLGLHRSTSLENCFQLIESNLFQLGIEKEKRNFNPHVTLARIKKVSPDLRAQQLLLEKKIPSITIQVNRITLMCSELTPNGARYTPVQRFSLRCK